MFRPIVHLGMLVGILAAALWGGAASPTRAAGAPRPASPVYPAAHLPVMSERFAYVTRDRTRFQSPGLRAYTALSGDPCMTYTFGVNGRSSTGTLTYSWAQEVGWCYNGSQVTYASVIYRHQTNLGWSYLGIDTRSEQWSSDRSLFQARSVGKFGLTCVGYSGGCSFYRYPYVSVVVYGNGTYSGWGSAND